MMKRDELISMLRKAKGKVFVETRNGHDVHYVQAVKISILEMIEKSFPGENPETGFSLSAGKYVSFLGTDYDAEFWRP